MRPFVPVEVKAGASGALRSIHQFTAAYASPLALRFDMNPPSLQQVRHITTDPQGKKQISFSLMSLPLYQVEHAAFLAKQYLEITGHG